MAEPPPLPTDSPSLTETGLPVVLPISHDPNWIGPLLFGTLLQFGVFSILLMQAIVFFARQGHGLNDGRLFRLYVAVVLLFTALDVTSGVWRIYNICVLLRPWAHLPYPWIEAMLTGVVVESVHGFFIFRCYKLSRSKLVLGVILVMQLIQVVAAIVACFYQATALDFQQIRATTIALDSTGVALDVVISGTLFINLWRQRTGQGEVDAVVLQIIRITIESIVPCVICLILILISAVYLWTLPLGTLFPVAIPLVSPLYANALLTTLNARLGLRRQLDNERDNRQLSFHNNIQVAQSNQGWRTSQMNSFPLTSSVQGGTMPYDVALTNAIELSSSGESGSDQTASKARPLGLDDDAILDLSPEYPPTLSSKQARNSLVLPV